MKAYITPETNVLDFMIDKPMLQSVSVYNDKTASFGYTDGGDAREEEDDALDFEW